MPNSSRALNFQLFIETIMHEGRREMNAVTVAAARSPAQI
jgi:hypothetical protein